MKNSIAVVMLSAFIGCSYIGDKPNNETVKVMDRGEFQKETKSEDARKSEEFPLIEVFHFDEKTGDVIFKVRILRANASVDNYVYTEIDKVKVALRVDTQRHTSLKAYNRLGDGIDYQFFYIHSSDGAESKIWADHCELIEIMVGHQEDLKIWNDWVEILNKKRNDYTRKTEEEFNSYKKRVLPPK